MEAKSIVRKKAVAQRNEYLKQGATNIVYLLCGVLVSRGAVLGELAPFGASFAAAAPKKYLLSSLIGTALGYILLNPSDSFRYISVVISIGGIRWLMGDLKKISSSRLFAPLVAFVPVFASGFALLFSSSSTMSSFADCIIEAVISGAAGYFISITIRLAGEKRGITAYTQQETASLVMTGCVLILAFGSIAFENVSLGRIIAVVIILLCARYGGIVGGSISGIATGSIFSIADRTLGFICGSYAFGGLISGLFVPLGKLGCAIAFVLSDFVMALAFGDANLSGVVIEGIVGATAFMILPKELESFISPVFSADKNSSIGEVLRRNIVMRLSFASKAIYNVRKDVNDVSEKLSKICSPTFDWVCQNVAGEVCSSCGLKMYCFEHKGGVTRDDFRRLEEILEMQGKISAEDVDREFVKKCCKKGEIADSMNKNYSHYLSCLEAQRRTAEIRGVVAGQFSGISDILSDLSDEFKSTMRCDSEASERIIAGLSELGAIPVECICLISDGGRMSVELELSDKSDKNLTKGHIMREVSRCCGRRFDLPVVTNECGRIRIAMCEMPSYDVEIGSDQHIANNGKLCGDCLDYFNDGFGKTYAIVCDGMGTGGRAAVDGNMAVSVMGRLLRSGLTADSSLQIVNSALMIKSDDESLSTLDVTSVDLYTGKVTLRKAGAPVTFIKKNGRVSSREMPSMPAGILNNIKFTTDTINLSTGDMVVMVSDGVINGDEKWLEKLIKSWNEGSCQDLAQEVVAEAIRRRQDSHDDDITALAIKITDNN